VLASVRPAGGTWGAPQTLDNTSASAPKLDLAVDPAGNFIAFFSRASAVAGTIAHFSSYLPAGQTTFGSLQQLGSAVAGTTGVAVAMAPDGTAWAIFGIGGATAGVAGSRAPGAASAWTTKSTGMPTDISTNVDLAVTADGTPTLANVPGTAPLTLRHSRFNGTSWVQITTPQSTLGAGQNVGNVKIIPDAGNRTTTLWTINSTVTQLSVDSCPPGVTAPTQCTAATDLNFSNSIFALNFQLAGNPATGDAVATWTENTGVRISRRTGALGAWPTASTLVTGATPAAGFDSNNGLMHVYGDGNNHLQFLFASSGSALTPPGAALTDPTQTWTSPQLAADGSGDTLGAWVSPAGTAIQSAVYDVQPPSTPVITAASTAITGSPMTFAGNATDTWGPVTYAWDYGDGTTDTGASPSHTYATAGNYTARVTATDGVGNQSSATQAVAVADPPQPTQPTGPAPLSRPIAGQTVNLEPVGGTVLVKVPGSNTFVPLVLPAQVVNGAIIDARKGRVRITIDNGLGGLDVADFYGGIFQFFQPKVKAGQLWFANLYLYGGSFAGCPKAPKNPKIATLSGKKKGKQSPTRSVRHLWGSGEGAFRTVGRFSSATVRGTTWLTDDRCNGTLTKVTAGKIGVRDFVLRKTIVLKKGKSYLAKPKARAARKAAHRAARKK
jgi:PKD repeat protein